MQSKQPHSKSTTASGRYAEKLIARILHNRGFSIVCMNWRTRWCEVDIIAQKGTLYFIEVKFRKNQLTAFESINEHKVRKLRLASKLWLAKQNGSDQIVKIVFAAIWKNTDGNYCCRFREL